MGPFIFASIMIIIRHGNAAAAAAATGLLAEEGMHGIHKYPTRDQFVKKICVWCVGSFGFCDGSESLESP